MFITMIYNMEYYRCPSIDERIRKLWYIYTMEYYMAIKRRESYYL